MSGLRTSDKNMSEIKRLLPAMCCEGQEKPCPGAACSCQNPLTLYLTLGKLPGSRLLAGLLEGVGYINEVWGAAPATAGCCFLCSGQKADEQMVQDGSWGGTAPEMVRGDVVVQGMGCRKCLELPLACIALCESGTCPNIRFTAQRTNMDCVVRTQHF